jgi:hypothetical protein
MRLILLAISIAVLMIAGGMSAQAHHSFAVHFVPDKEIDVTGVVTKFHFANPHGVIFFDVEGEDGQVVGWKGETNSPNLLKRRGWKRDSLKAGDKITIHGWPARDDAPMLRVGYVTKEDGTVLRGQSSAEGIKGID